MKIDPTRIKWLLVERSTGEWIIMMPERGNECIVIKDEGLARLIAAAPAMLRFLALLSERNNAPAGIDAERMLSLAGIEIERAKT